MEALTLKDITSAADLTGLERLAGAGGKVSKATSVASLFAIRLDTAGDEKLAHIGEEAVPGKSAIAATKVAYVRLTEIFSGPRWKKVAARGARVRHPLWASPDTKDPLCSDTLYVDRLVDPDTVITVSPATLSASRDHSTVEVTRRAGLQEAHAQRAHAGECGVDVDGITEQLQKDGVTVAVTSFESLVTGIAEKRKRRTANWPRLSPQRQAG